ncbi:MAG: hypothetical protein U0797_18960 [Gemmataceae bacterium]
MSFFLSLPSIIRRQATPNVRQATICLEPLEGRCLLSAGALDPTFGNGGIVTTSLIKGDDIANAVLIQPWDGKIVAAGSTWGGNSMVMGLTRYNADGSLDGTFGSGGKVTSKIGTNWWNAAALYPHAGTANDGKIVEAGAGSLARFNANGSTDTSFGKRGLVAVSWAIAGVVVQPDGKIVVAGDNGSAFMLSRYNANGTLDTSFGAGGTATLSLGSSGGYANALGLQADGKLVIAGAIGPGPDTAWELARFNANGTLDTTFNSAGAVPGTVTTAFTAGAGPLRGLAIYPGTGTDTADYGKIVAAGSITGNPGGINSSQIALARYNADGTADSTFGLAGQVVTPFPSGGGVAWAVALQADGEVVLAGQTYQYPGNGHWAFSLLRYNTDGSLDTTFGSGGIVATPNATNDNRAWGVAIQSDGRIVAAGSTFGSTGWDFQAARYLASASQANSFLASSSPVTTDSSGMLTASGVTDRNANGVITQVAFYEQSDGTNPLQGYGAQTGPGVWAFHFTANPAPGAYSLFAQAEDSYGVFGELAVLTLTVQ